KASPFSSTQTVIRRCEVNRSRKGKQVFRSIIEFEKKYLPKSLEKRTAEKLTDARALGISLAKESLDQIRKQLSR
ncbi:MAG: hypothetical protein ABID54_09265, partial [Pseudomonadota bacterium]